MKKFLTYLLIVVFNPIIVLSQKVDEFEKKTIQYQNFTTNSLDSIIWFNYTTSIDSIPDSKRVYKYDLNGNLINYERYIYDEWYYKWVGQLKEFSNYDMNGNEILSITYDWSPINNDWYFTDKWEGAYNSNNNMIWGIDSEWDSISNDWVYNNKGERFYNNLGLVYLAIHYLWNNNQSVWDYDYKTETYYVNDTLVYLSIGYLWNNNQSVWDYNYKTETYYEGDTLSSFNLKWNIELGDWEFTDKTRKILDENSNITEIITWDWDNLNNDWIYHLKNDLDYDNYNNMISNLFYIWDTVINSFVNKCKELFEFDEQGHKLLEENYQWDGDDDEWDGISKFTYSFSDTLNTDTFYVWNDYSNKWDYDFYSETIINQFGYESWHLAYQWNYITWDITSKDEYIYDNNWNRIIDIHWVFDDFWKYDRKIFYYYSESSNIANNLKDSFKIFPIPANDMLFIQREKENDNKILKAKIINTSGVEILRFDIYNSITSVNVDNLSSGFYFLVVDDETYKLIKK